LKLKSANAFKFAAYSDVEVTMSLLITSEAIATDLIFVPYPFS